MDKAKKRKARVKGHIWFVGFRESSRPLPIPWRWLVKKEGFKHVYAMRFDPDNDCWILCEWLGTSLHINVIRGEKADWMFHSASVSGALLSYESSFSEGVALNFRMPIYCVTWVKHLLGLSYCPAVTPYQLFCALRKRGASVIFGGGDV